MRVDEALAAAFPDGAPRVTRTIDTGWDSVALALEGGWMLRVARRDVVAADYEAEVALLPELAPTLPLRVPVPVRADRGWILTRRIDGERIAADASPRLGTQLGTFLRALHAFPVERAVELGAVVHEPQREAERFRRLVLPLLDRGERERGARLLDAYATQEFGASIVHMDLGPDHVLVEGDTIVGIIDWTDVRIFDPAIDLAWALYGTRPQFARAVADAYGADETVAARARVYHAIGPWHEVTWGLDGRPEWVGSGLAGVRARLPEATGDADTMAS